MSSVNFAQPDVTLRLDLSGIIRRATPSNTISDESLDAWVGLPFADTVAEGGNALVRQMLEDARSSGVSRYHQVQQRFPSGRELALEYTTVRLGGNDGLVAIGRNLEAVADLRSRLVAAQRSMERDYWKLREVETRYRLLFDASSQPVLLIGADDTQIVEANPAAIRALGVTGGRELLPEILPAQRDIFRSMLARVREQGKAPGIVMHLGPDRQPWLVRASLMAADPAAVFVLQLSPSAAASAPADKGGGAALEGMIERLPEGFLVLDMKGSILRTNRAFLALIEQPAEEAVLGQSLSRWMARPGADVHELLAGLPQQRAVSRLPARIRSERGAEVDVELTAAANADENPRYVGVLLRHGRPARRTAERPAAPSHAERIGTTTLREIVQETISLVERNCIEAALAKAKGNRSAAAEMLGLSRQSLYSKLGRYALGGDEPAAPRDREPGEE